jgi:non-ribosomal peptide synthase protein (TIGR01720 family)
MQISRGQPVRLPPKTTSFRQWALDLEEYARSEVSAGELEYWTAAAAESAEALPADMPAGNNLESSAEALTAALTAEETRRLLHAVPAAVDAGIQHALLAALGYSIGRWAGTPSVRVDFESHGREDIFAATDLSRTVGWFTALFPLVLDAAGEFDPQERVRRVKARMAGVPRGGIGYGLLRYLSPDAAVRDKLKSLPAARIVFNYLGQSDQALGKAEAFEISAESPGPDRSPAGRRTHWLEVNSGIFSGCLQLEWTYSGHLYRRRTVERLAGDFMDFLRALLEELNSGEIHPVIDTALEEFGWDSTQLQGVLAALDDLEADRP